MSVQPEKPSVKGTPKTRFDHFPHLPPYQHPQTGVIARLPTSWIPYAQVMRLDRPAGLYAFYIPYLVGTIYAACIADPAPDLSAVVRFAAILLPLNIILRGIACVWNDNVDQEFDRKVKRCRHRPIARGAITSTQGHIFTAMLVFATCPFLASMPWQCSIHMAGMITAFFLYALAKRVTYYPQVVLGFPFGWAVFFCVAAFGMDPFKDHLPPTLALFGANVLWTIVYDTIYAHQDVVDDARAGVKSMALRFQDSTKVLASLLALGMVLLLTACGLWIEAGLVYFAGTVAGVAIAMAYYLYDVDLRSPESCGHWFHMQFWTVGAGLISGFLGNYVLRDHVLA